MSRKMLVAGLVLLICLLAVSSVYAAPPARFNGHWRGVDAYDGSNMQLTISGGAHGEYRLKWTDDYFFCGGPEGEGIGTGTLQPDGTLYIMVHFTLPCWEGDSEGVLTLLDRGTMRLDYLNCEFCIYPETFYRPGH